MIDLCVTKRTDKRLLELMPRHYSQPKGFVGRNICFSITYKGVYYGHIVAGSATRHLKGRHEFLGTSPSDLNSIVNNIFFHIEKVNGRYPMRNFAPRILAAFTKIVPFCWKDKYGDSVVGFESLVELPRTGECYIRAGWEQVGTTIGYQCKRIAGKGTDSWTGKRVWNTDDLKPKLVFCFKPS